MTKLCTKCNLEKSLDLFSKHTRSRDGRQSHCKACYALRERIKRIGKPCISCGKPKESGVPKGARLCLSCANICFECGERPRRQQHRTCSVCSSIRDRARKALPESKYRARISKIKSLYKVTESEAKRLEKITSCEVCNKDITYARKHVDHCHNTGIVRGVLCFNCNVALGNVREDISILQKLIQYLEVHGGGRESDGSTSGTTTEYDDDKSRPDYTIYDSQSNTAAGRAFNDFIRRVS